MRNLTSTETAFVRPDAPVAIDRLSVRERPAGCPILHQRWSRLAFLHWRVSPDQLRPLVPAPLDLDFFEGNAFVGLTLFTVSRMRPHLLPSLPGLSDAHQVNVRTYVHCNGVPGLWFLALDATNALAVWGARLAYHLPFSRARMDVTADTDRVCFASERKERRNVAPARLNAVWRVGDPMPPAQPGTLEFFLIERYVLYAAWAGRLLRARIHHRPWPLRHAALERVESSMLEAHGLRTADSLPMIHAQGKPFDVDIWLAERVDRR